MLRNIGNQMKLLATVPAIAALLMGSNAIASEALLKEGNYLKNIRSCEVDIGQLCLDFTVDIYGRTTRKRLL